MNVMPDDNAPLTKINLDTTTPVTSEKESVLVPDTPPAAPSSKSKKVFLGVLAFLAVFIIYNAIAFFIVYRSGLALKNSAANLAESGQSKDLGKIKSSISDTKKSLNSFNATYKLISWARIVPYFGAFVGDGQHAITAGRAGLEAGEIIITAIEPYSDVLGFTAGGSGVLGVSESGEKTAEERIDFLVGAIPGIIPQMDKISEKFAIVQAEISQIDPNRYPVKYKSLEVRPNIQKAQNLIAEASNFVVNGKPLLENTQYLLGMDSPRNYLIIFQNDKELRPTGGFMTGYSIMKVEKAKFSPTTSDDIYNLDAKYKPSIPAPDPIVKYIKGPYVISKNLRLRDMNWSPDFAESMKMVAEAMSQVGVTNIDGIIAVDTQLLVNILDVIGPIGVPGFGNFSNNIDPECNCPQVIHELESYADVEGPIIWDPLTGKIISKPKNADNRKKIIGPLMNSILANAMGQPKEKLAPLFEAGFKSLSEKHVILYMFDEKVQKAGADFGIGGIIKDFEGDYLHINDANLGGRKSNLYATSETDQVIELLKDGSVEKTVTITYKNPQKHDGWLNSVLPTWVRVYVPKGSQLIAAEGLEAKDEPYDDLGKTVFAGFFQLRPEGAAKITFKYKLPMKFSKEYRLLIQKQPGTDKPLYTIKLGKHEEEILLSTDKEIFVDI